jgi:serine/threonine-protein kinase
MPADRRDPEHITHGDLESAIKAIVAGTPVDWAALRWQAPDAGSVVRDLQTISAIAALHCYEADDASVTEAESCVEEHTTWGALTILDRVGEGSFGEVYRAWDPRLDREVALKLLKQPSIGSRAPSSTIDEGRLLARVRDPNVVTVYGADVVDGRVGIWMEFVRGRTLAALVSGDGPLAADETLAIGLAVCRALAAVHQAGFVHRDVNGQNVMREQNGRIVLMDFGTVQHIEHARGGALAGTPRYLAPEVLEGLPATPRSDVYSAGVLLFYCATGAYPLTADTIDGLCAAHRGNVRQKLRDLRADLPVPFVDAVETALSPDPADRFEDGGAFGRALESMRERPPGSSLRASLLVAAAFLVVLAGAGGSALWVVSNKDGRRQPRNADPYASAFGTGPSTRKIDVPGFVPSGPPSASGEWLPGVDWNADGNLAVLDLFTGERRPLTRKGDRDPGYTERAAVSPDEHSVVYSWYTSARQDTSELRIADRERNSVRTLYRNSKGLSTPVAWSPEGARVLALVDRSGGPWLTWIDVSTGVASDLTALPGYPRNASLAPDGTRVVYDSASTAGSGRHLNVCDAMTGRSAPLLAEPANDLAPLWTRDGAGIVFASDRGGRLGLWYLPMANGQAAGEPTQLRGDMGAFAPVGFGRGGALVYQVITGTVDIYTAAVDLRDGGISHPRVVATHFVGMNLFSDWSPDGRSLAFTSRRGEVGFERHSQVLVIHDLETKTERTLTPDLTGMTMPRWSPDGRSIVLTADGPRGSGVYRISVSEEAVTQVLATNDFVGFPQWRSDGRALLLLSGGPPVHGIQELSLTTGARRTLVDRAAAFALAHDGRRFAFSRTDADGIHIFVASLTGGPAAVVTDVPGGNVVEVAGWTPDDQEIVFSRRERKTGARGLPTSMFAVAATGGIPRTLGVIESDDPRTIHLSPDGAMLAFEAGYPATSTWLLERFLNR